jgi:serine/threonine-protein kinase PpkA
MIELPGYNIEKQLGRGGMARVYLARHIGLDRLVAIKVLSKDLDGDKSFSDRFIREARIVARLSHQNIITVHDVGVHNEFHYIAMEYLPGETLDDKIKKKLDIRQIFGITKQIAAALDFAHKKGIVHRDVKPDNILFREDGTAVLTDFGIARTAKSETRMTVTGTVIGTPHYMSPEQAQGLEIGPWSDLYSLGIVLYEMLSGKVPFDADSTIAVVFKHINEPVPDLDEPYKQYQPLVNTLLAKEPDARYQSGREVIADIEALDRGESPANAALISNQTAINPAVSIKTGQTAQTGETTSQQAGKASSGKLKLVAAAAVISIAAAITAIAFFPIQKTSNKADDTATSQREINLAYEKQQLEKRQRELDKRAAENALLEQQRIEAERLQKEKSQQQAMQREQARLVAQKKQQQAEAEARKAKQELQALKQSQLEQKQLQQKKLEQEQIAQQKKQATNTITASTSSTAQDKPDVQPLQETPAKAKKTGLLAGWLGDTDNNSDEYISDLFEAADNALATENYASARQNYRGILQIEPNNQRAQQGLINVERRVSENTAHSNDAYTSDLLKAADNALQTDRLSSASYNYLEVLRLSPENRYAQQGLNEVFNRYLALAVEEAHDDDFDDAAEYYLAAKKLRPNDEKLKTVGQEIAQLQNQ